MLSKIWHVLIDCKNVTNTLHDNFENNLYSTQKKSIITYNAYNQVKIKLPDYIQIWNHSKVHQCLIGLYVNLKQIDSCHF